MQSLAGWIGTVYRTVLVGSTAVDRQPQKQEDGDAALAIDTVMEVDASKKLQAARFRPRCWKDVPLVPSRK